MIFSYDRGPYSFETTPSDMKALSLVKSLGAFGKAKLGSKTPLPFRVGYTPICAFIRSVFSEVGYFDESLGIGTTAEGGEDIDMFYRILRHGYKIRYTSKAPVYHRHRTKHQAMRLTAWRCGRGIKSMIKKYWISDPYMFLIYFGVLAFFVLNSIKFSIKGDVQFAELFTYELSGLLGESPIEQ
jgi:GT2 family glycosyltransferase